MARLEISIDASLFIEGYKAGIKAGVEIAAEIMAPTDHIESELNKNNIDLPDGEERI